MGYSIQTRDRPNYPRRTGLILQQTNILLDELESRRKEELAVKLTKAEIGEMAFLEKVFKTERPAEEIAEALEDEKEIKKIRKDYLTAEKMKKEKEEEKEEAEKDTLGILLLAAGTPLFLVGGMLIETFQVAGIAIIIAGVGLYLPAFLHEIIVKRKAKKEYKKASKKVRSLTHDIEERTERVDAVCKKYGFPVNDHKKEAYISDLLNAAKEFERICKKKTDYELLLEMNNSTAISKEIQNNIRKVSGKEIKEGEYRETLEHLMDQMD